MKKMIHIILLAALMLALAVPVSAVEYQRYDLDDLEISLKPEKSRVLFTRDYERNKKLIIQNSFPFTADDLSEEMKEYDEYAYITTANGAAGHSRNQKYDMNLYKYETEYEDFRNLTDSELEQAASKLATFFSDVTLLKYGTFKTPLTTFVLVYARSDRNYYEFYFTSYNNSLLLFSFYTLDEKTLEKEQSAIEDLMWSVRLKKGVNGEALPEPTESFTYTHEPSLTVMEIPEDWSERILSEESDEETISSPFETSYALFTANYAPVYGIAFLGFDLWSEMKSSEKKGLTRAECDNSKANWDEIIEMMQGEDQNCTPVTFGKTEYMQINMTENPTNGEKLGVPLYCYVHVENGFLYSLITDIGENHPAYSEFLSLVRSVKFPSLEEVEKITSAEISELLKVGISAVIRVGILGIVVTLVAKRKKVRKTEEQ